MRQRLPGERIAHRYSTARTYFFFANLIGFAMCLLCLGWGDTAIRLGTIRIHDVETLAPGGEPLILAPFLFAQIGSWFLFYDADREFHSQLGGRLTSEEEDGGRRTEDRRRKTQ